MSDAERDVEALALDEIDRIEVRRMGWPGGKEWCEQRHLPLAHEVARLTADRERLVAALALALNGIPDPMHPGIPKQFVTGLVCAQIVILDALGDDDPGDVEAARAALTPQADAAGKPECPRCGSDDYTDLDYSGCSECRADAAGDEDFLEHERRTLEGTHGP